MNTGFECAWRKVREAPQVTIDFGDGPGNGVTVRRTLNGNVATCVLDHEGRVLDVVGGVYTPEAYRARLVEAGRLYAKLRPRHPHFGERERVRAAHVAYHRAQGEQLATGGPALSLQSQGVTKAGIEIWALTALGQGRPKSPGDVTKRAVESGPKRLLATPGELPLPADTVLNETVRRTAIHRILAEVGDAVLDEALIRRVYREALHCDIDDPMLGLGGLLRAGYPFAR